MIMISIILIEPKTAENIGFIARSMKNFDLKNLIIIEPRCDLDIANKTAMHAKDILKKAKIRKKPFLKSDFSTKIPNDTLLEKSESEKIEQKQKKSSSKPLNKSHRFFFDKFDYLVGTTAILGTDNNIPRNPITPEELAEKLTNINHKKLNIGILIGREGSGLNNQEINMCDILVTIPASTTYPTMNVSHASIIIFYELFQKLSEKKSNSHINYATKKEKQIIQKLFNKLLNKTDFETKEKKDTQKKVWKRIFGKSMLTKREAFSVMGLFRKLIK